MNIVVKSSLLRPDLNKIFQKEHSLVKYILYVSNTGKIIGGGEISLLNLLNHLDRAQFLPIVTVPEEGDFVDSLRDHKIDYLLVNLPTIRSIRVDRVILNIFHFIRLFKIYQIDLIHANGSRAMLLSGLAAFISGVPCFWHLRVSDKSDYILDRCLFILAKRVIAISSAVVERLSWARKKEKIRLIPNGVDISSFHPKNKKYRNEICTELGFNPKFPIVSTICQLAHWKHVEVFIKAAANILLAQPQAQFIVCGREVHGSEGYQNMLENLAKSLGVRKKIIFTGFRPDVHKILGASDIFVLSSVGEAFGRVIIEAMANEVPVIATRSGGIPDIIEHGRTGFMFEPEDHRSLGQLAINILKDEALAKKIARTARNMVVKHFSIISHRDKIQSLYEEILRNQEDR